jgi:hypothetical protein
MGLLVLSEAVMMMIGVRGEGVTKYREMARFLNWQGRIRHR